MQDRFKFRIFDEKLNKMANWGDNPYHNMEIVNIICSNNPEFNSDNRFHLMQCTGKKDKNNKLIFAGDIVREYDEYGYVMTKEVVFLEDVMFGFNINVEFDYEIIGNIYENPELLEEK